MHSHLIKIFESNIIEHFPQDLNYGAPQKVFFAMTKKLKQLVNDMIRQIETKQEKANRLQKIADLKKNYVKEMKINKNQEKRFRCKQNVENICVLKYKIIDI